MTVEETTFEPFLRALREDDPQRLYDLAPCGYLTTTADGTIVKANRTFLAMCGRSADDLLDIYRFDQLLAAGGRIYHETHFAPMLRMQGSAREIALELAMPDGTRRPVLVNAVVDQDEAGVPELVRIAVFDASHRRAYEQELLAATRRAEESDARARALTATLQQTLLPPSPPAIRGLELAAEFLPGDEALDVGGDFYDVFQVGTDDWVLAVGDVCGRGVEAAVVTALARFTIRAEAMQHDEPAAVLGVLNRVLLGYHAKRFCTVALARVSRRDGRWTGSVACGGHPLPLLRSADGTVRPVGRYGTVLGVVPDVRVHDAPLTLDAGDSLVFYTDGVLEARRDDDFFGEDRTAESVARASGTAPGIAAGLVADVLGFKNEARHDDLAILVARAVLG